MGSRPVQERARPLLQGNHDFWWPGSAKKLGELLSPYPSIVGFPGIAAGFTGEHGGVRYELVSCDAAGFCPVYLLDAPAW